MGDNLITSKKQIEYALDLRGHYEAKEDIDKIFSILTGQGNIESQFLKGLGLSCKQLLDKL